MAGWVSFDEDGDGDTLAPAVVSSCNTKTGEDVVDVELAAAGGGSSKGWVKFEDSPPQAPVSTPISPGHRAVELQRAVKPQNTGGSIHSIADVMSQASDDHHSAIASSVMSSRGSFSGSHDNISSSREYMPLESSTSSSPKPGSITPNPEGWVRFGSSRKIVSSTPLKSEASERRITENRSLDNSGVSSPIPQNWVQFHDSHDLSLSSASSRPSPVASSCDNSITRESPVEEVNTRSKLIEIPNKQNQNVIREHSILERRKQQVIGLDHNSHGTGTASSTPIHMTDHANDLEVSMLSKVASASEAKYEPASPGNPFKTEMLTLKQLEKQKAMDEQVRRTVSPYNPFLNMGESVAGNTPVKSITNTSWTTFDETETNEMSIEAHVMPSSPGNPFAELAAASELHNRSNYSSTFTPQQQAQGQIIYAAAAAAAQQSAAVTATSQQSVATSQPMRQVMAVQPLLKSGSVQQGEQRSAASLSQNNSTSQPISPIGMKQNQWQQQQQFFPTTSQTGYSPASQNPAESKQIQAAIVTPTAKTKASDLPDGGKLALNTQTSIKSNLSSPSSEKLFLDQYPREQVDFSEGWPLKLRCPDKKRIAGSRYWQPVHVRLSEGNILQLFSDRTRKEPFRELPLQSNYEIGLPNLQQFDVKGKIHTIKMLYMSYKEKRKVSAKSLYEKEAQLEELMKLGSLDFKVFQSFVFTINDALMKLTLYQDRGAHYQQDMIKVIVSDECRCLVNGNGDIVRQSITVGLNVLSFLSGSPDCAIGLNDVQVKGLDVVARQHIIPNKTSDWIKMHDVELHKCANKNVFVDSRMIEFQPLNACRFRLMQFHVQPSEQEDLPLQVKAALSGEGTHMELRVDLLIPACTGKRNPAHYTCDNILVHIPIPEQWIWYFRKPKRMGQSSIHAVTKRPDVIKRGCHNPRLLEISVGTAKYEHAYRAVMWRIDRLPEKPTGHPSTYILKCHLNLISLREVSKTFSRVIEVEYHTPHTTASKTTVRSLAVSSEKSPEKRIRYMCRYEYQVQIEDNYIRHSPVDDDDAPGRCLTQ